VFGIRCSSVLLVILVSRCLFRPASRFNKLAVCFHEFFRITFEFARDIPLDVEISQLEYRFLLLISKLLQLVGVDQYFRSSSPAHREVLLPRTEMRLPISLSSSDAISSPGTAIFPFHYAQSRARSTRVMTRIRLSSARWASERVSPFRSL